MHADQSYGLAIRRARIPALHDTALLRNQAFPESCCFLAPCSVFFKGWELEIGTRGAGPRGRELQG